MIQVNDLLSWVVGRLDLSKKADRFVIADFYRALNDALIKLNREYVALEQTETITTVAGQGKYDLTQGVRILRIIEIDKPWKESVTYVTPQKMREIKQLVLGGNTFSTIQPKYWTVVLGEFPYIDLEYSGAISADLSLQLRYSYIPKFWGKTVVKTAILEIPEEYELYLELYIAKSLAPKYKPEELSFLRDEFQLEDTDLKRFRTRRQQGEVIHTDIYKY